MKKSHPHVRRIRLSVNMPVTVDMYVSTDDANPSEDSEWSIKSVRSTSCEANARMVEECLHSDDFAELATLAAAAKDEA